MCERYSWIIKDDKVVFLTGKDVFKSKRGRELREYTTYAYADDWYGHGAIRWFYNFTGGTDRECTDFSSPDNFPPSLVKAIKDGLMWEFGITKNMLCMLRKPAWREYEDVRQAALWKTSSYFFFRQPAWREYEVVQPAWREYEDVKLAAWKNIWADTSNRKKCWL